MSAIINDFAALPAAPPDVTAERIDARAAEHLPCAVCKSPALFACIADTRLGPRWLDLCGPHAVNGFRWRGFGLDEEHLP